MRFGVVYDLDKADLIASLGYDYIEGHVNEISAMDPNEFNALAKRMDNCSIKCETACILFPYTLKVVGPEFNEKKIEDYLDSAFSRLSRLGTDTVVFGSGGARWVPDGFDRADAWHQLVQTCRIIDKKCAEYGIITGLEAMNTRESNIMNLQAQAIGLASDTDRPNICLLVDFYHFSLGGEDPSVIDQGKKLVHTHISNPDGRVYLQPTDRADYASFFSALARIGYHGRMSYEGKLKDDERELTVTLATMKKLAADAGI